MRDAARAALGGKGKALDAYVRKERTVNETQSALEIGRHGDGDFKRVPGSDQRAGNQAPVELPDTRHGSHTYRHRSAGSAEAPGALGTSSAASRRPWRCRCGSSPRCPGRMGGPLWRHKEAGLRLCLRHLRTIPRRVAGVRAGRELAGTGWHSCRPGPVGPPT